MLRGGDDECDKEDRKPDEFEPDQLPALSGPPRRSSAAAATTRTAPRAATPSLGYRGRTQPGVHSAKIQITATGTTYTTAVDTGGTWQTIDARPIKLPPAHTPLTLVRRWPQVGQQDGVDEPVRDAAAAFRHESGHDTPKVACQPCPTPTMTRPEGAAPHPCGKYGTKEGTMPTKSKAKRSLPRMSPEVKAAYREIQHGVRGLGKSIAEIQQGLRKAEREIEAAARARIQALRKEVRAQLAGLEKRRRDLAQILKRLASAAGESSQDIKRSAESALAEARATADSVIERFRRALRT
jgi:hypothetical protein